MSINKDKVKEVILENQRFVQSVHLVRRSIKIQPNFNYIFVGIRRAGKSFYLFQCIHDLLAEGHKIEEILYSKILRNTAQLSTSVNPVFL